MSARQLILFLALPALLLAGCGRRETPTTKEQITYSKHVAPVLLANCASCHRPGQSGPFPLLTYADAKKHGRTIVEVTSQRTMPPWLPAGPHGQFVGDRRLSEAQIELLKEWWQAGAPEGSAADLPKAPEFPSDWPLGKPDLVVTFTEPYVVPADGPNIYRNFVVPLNLPGRRWVRAMDLRPSSATVHHALLALDRSGTAKRWDARDREPGYDGFTLLPEFEVPPHFLGWHPGKQAMEVPRGLAWPIEAGTELVVQLHLRPGGKAENVAPKVAFYFTDEPATNMPLKVGIDTLKIAIPAGASNHTVNAKLTLQGDSDLLAIAPHTHFLARQIKGRARFPDGSQRELLHVPEWNFDWQDSYRYAQPVFLPTRTEVELEIVFDNSTANPRNPHSPPKPVRYGVESSDEMAVLWLQVLPRNQASATSLERGLQAEVIQHNIDYNTYLLERDPTNSRAHVGLARALYMTGKLEPASSHLATARKLDPKDDDAALLDGIVWQFRQQPEKARAAFEDCLRLNPNHSRAHGCFAVLSLQQGWLDVAEPHLREALRINPNDATARDLLRQLMEVRGK